MWVLQALRSRPGTYTVAVLAVLLVFSLRLGLEELLEGQVALLSFILAIIVAAAWGGLGPGLLATGLGALLSVVWFIGAQALIGNPVELFRLGIFVLEGTIMSMVFARLHQSNRVLFQTLSELEHSKALIEQAALNDVLTGLGNRRAFEQDLQIELARAEREDMPLTLLMADLDRLKQVNDQQGHAEGDRLIQTFARLLRETLRLEDRMYRIGGDEFAMLLPGVSRSECALLNDRLSSLVEGLKQAGFPQSGASLGLAVFPEDAQDGQTLLRLADERMYSNKEQSRKVRC